MLALMPQTPPIHELHKPNSMGNNAMSLALLPSSRMTYSQQAVPTLLPPVPSPSKRPKLSLNTSNVTPVFGNKNSTSLRLETLSATSPTARNTFRNKQSPGRSPVLRSKKPALTPIATNVAIASTQTLTPSNIELPESADTAYTPLSSALSATSVSTVDSLPSEIPYRLPFNASSILINGPIPRTRSPRISFAQSRPMFPAAKKVSFSAALPEEIRTTKYTLRHSDIESPIISAPEVSTEEKQEEGTNTVAEPKSRPSLQLGTKHALRSEDDDSDNPPVTPVAGRRKKDRQWVWTLGPISSDGGTGTDDVETIPS